MTFQRGHYYGGGWPLGRRRNTTNKDIRPLLLAARKEGYSYADIAWLLDSDKKTVWRFATGRRLPRDEFAAKVRKRFGFMLA